MRAVSSNSLTVDLSAAVQMAGKDEGKPGLEKPGQEDGGSSRIRITLTCQEVKPLEKGMSS
jgi:hypothetical protein